MLDRIERHDVVNAMLLAVVLLLLGFGVITALRSLQTTVDEGLVTSETLESEVLSVTTIPPDDAGVDDTGSTTAVVPARPPGEVQVRVANGAGRRGVAGAGSDLLSSAGYDTLDPKNGPATDESVVYYLSGFAAEAVEVASVLGLDASAIEPMPSDPGVELADAKIIVILGASSEF